MLTNREVRSWISALTEQWLGLAYAQIAIAVLVAILGIVNTLTVSIIDRRRELGVLQAVGGLRNQIRRTIWMEALTIGVVGLVMGFAVGSVTLHYVLEMSQRDITGMSLPYTFPWAIAGLLVPLILGVGVRRLALAGGVRGAGIAGGGAGVRVGARDWDRDFRLRRTACRPASAGQCGIREGNMSRCVPVLHIALALSLAVTRARRRAGRAADHGGGAEARAGGRRSTTRACCRWSTRRARSPTNAGSTIAWARTAAAGRYSPSSSPPR